MATYAVGDVQGHLAALLSLVEATRFDPAADRFWFVGDLVNRGPDSLGVLRWMVAHDEHVTCVLGNHDLRLLATGLAGRAPRRRDTFQGVLEAADGDALIDWLRNRPVLVREGEYVLVHAGLPPEWTPTQAEQFARRAEEALRGDALRPLLAACSRKCARAPAPEAPGLEAAGDALCILTHIRTVTAEGAVDHRSKGPPGAAPEGRRPWFELRPAEEKATYVVGHWAALGLRNEPRLLALDSGVAWDGPLSAVRLEDRAVFQSR